MRATPVACPRRSGQAHRAAPRNDGIAAFNYYIRHFNHGRAFILAGALAGLKRHGVPSRGYMKAHPDVYKRMIAAYVVGYSITPHYLAQNPFLKFATGPNDTGVIVSWNTEAPTIKGTNPVLLPGAWPSTRSPGPGPRPRRPPPRTWARSS